jgi:microcystin-dependent protein
MSVIITAPSSSAPTGSIIPWLTPTAPTGYLLMDGSAVSRTTYAALFAVIGVSQGIGDGSTTFNLPDWRGRFPRGLDASGNGRDVDLNLRTSPVAGTHNVTGGATTNGSPNITVTTTANLAPGMTVTGTGIPASSVVRSITSATVFVLGNLANTADVNATATNTGLTFTVSKGPTGAYVGSVQSAATARPTSSFTTDNPGNHTHGIGTGYANANNITNVSSVASRAATNTSDGGGSHTHTITGGGDNETRPQNASSYFVIKF